MQPIFQNIINNSKASGSRPKGPFLHDVVDRSPICSLNEDIVHVSLRLGPLPLDDNSIEKDLPPSVRLLEVLLGEKPAESPNKRNTAPTVLSMA